MDKVSDLISRQAVIDALRNMAVPLDKDLVCENIYERDRTLNNAIDVMRTLPSAQTENDWIPVARKAHPDKEGKYLVTDDAGGMATVDEDVFMFLDDGTPCWLYSQNVTAWMPLPEPYRGWVE